MDIPNILQHLRPGSAWAMNGDDYSGLVWLDAVTDKPTLGELQNWRPSQEPIVVSMRSLQLALVRANLYQVVTALINGIPDATQKLETQIYWAKSVTVDRQHPVVLGLVAALAANGVTEVQVNAVFAAAQALDNPTL